MDAIILAGGYGTRLRPLTYTRPKPLLPVAGRPMVEWVLDRLPPEVDHVIVAVNWLAEELERYFEGSDRDLRFTVVREEEPLGTGGAVKNCEVALTGDAFFVLNSDIVSEMDLGAMIQAHAANDALGTISLREVEPAEVVHFGVADTAAEGEAGAVLLQGFVEKPARPEDAPSRLINAGAYILSPEVLDTIPEGRLVSLEKEIFPLLLAEEGLYGVPFAGDWVDVGDPARLLEAGRMLAPSYEAGPESAIDPSAHWERSLGGARCRVGAGAVVEGCVLGDDVTIDVDVRLKDCVVGDNEHVRDSAEGLRIWTRPRPEGYPDKQVGNAIAAKA